MKRNEQPPRAQLKRSYADDSIRSELAILRADLDNFAGRGPHKSISNRMKLKIVGSLTKNNLSMRQIENELKDLSGQIEYFKQFKMPSRKPIQSVAYSLATLNVQQSIAFLESADQLMISFDGSTKMSKGIQAVLLVNQDGDCHCLEAFETANGTAEALAHGFLQTFVSLSFAGVQEGIIDISPDIWSRTQIAKISMIMSDSCNSASKTKTVLAQIIKDLCEDEDMIIFVGDCGMHLVSNAEKQLVKTLSKPTVTVLKTINEVLASDKDALTGTWNRQYPQAKMKREHGSRFSHTSHNAVNALLFVTELRDFAANNGHSIKLRELENEFSKHESLIKAELQAMAACWFLVLSPLWIHLRKSHAKPSLDVIDSFTNFAKYSESDLTMKVTDKVSNPSYNSFMHLHSPITDSEAVLRDTLIGMIQENHESADLNGSIKKMLKGASSYMLKLSDKWVRDAIPDESVKFPFSNQVN